MKNTTWQEVVKMWRAGELVSSAELGGLGPGYEQAIQILLFEIMSEWKKDTVPAPKNGKYPKSYETHVDVVAHKLDKDVGGFSGAQVDVAKATAYQFMHHGYAEMMNKLPDDRRISVSKAWPSVEKKNGNLP